MSIPLFEKYRPKTFLEIKGQDIAIAKVKAYFTAFHTGMLKKKALLLHGPAGSGKTTLAHVLALERECEIFELNASDLRNRAKLEEVLKPSTLQHSLFSKGKVILVDEVDGVTATDRGGLPELIALIEKTKFPIIITANDVWQQKFSLLRRKCDLVQMKELQYVITFDILKTIVEKEKKTVEEELLKGIAAKSKGDLRAAVNDLQSILHIEPGQIKHEHIGEREKTTDIFNALKAIFKFKTEKNTINIFDNVDLDLDKIVLWVEKNIPKEYRGKELVKAYEHLSKADVFKGRIYRQQYWRFLVYQNFLLSAGISSVSKLKNPTGFTKYEKPTRILKIWMANNKNAKKKSIAIKYAAYAHISKKRALREFPILSLTINDFVEKKLDLSEQESEFLQEYKGAIKVAHGLNKFAV
jgi:replication factor C large subunit